MAMFRPKGNIAEETTIHISEDDAKLVNSEFNLTRIAEIQKSWSTGTQTLTRDNRVYVREGTLQKLCRKGLKARHFFLFNDILVYGTNIAKGKYAHQHIMALEDMSISDVPDSEEAINGFQINHQKKSFLVYAPSLTDKSNWTANLRKYINLASDRDEDDEVDARAVWVPDSKVRVCMCCQQVEFSLMQRKHHCRNCGKVVCNTCSSFKAILNKDRSERVCTVCHAKLGGKAPGDVPVAGVASTERAGAPVVPARPSTKPSLNKRNSQPEPGEDSSDSSDASDVEDSGGTASVSAIKSFVAGANNSAVPRQTPAARPRPSVKHQKDPSLTNDERRMHELSNEERMAIMLMVKDCKIGMDQALEMIAKGEKPGAAAAPTNKAGKPVEKAEKPPPRPSVPPASGPKVANNSTAKNSEPQRPASSRDATGNDSKSTTAAATSTKPEVSANDDSACSKRKGKRRTFKSPQKLGDQGDEQAGAEADEPRPAAAAPKSQAEERVAASDDADGLTEDSDVAAARQRNAERDTRHQSRQIEQTEEEAPIDEEQEPKAAVRGKSGKRRTFKSADPASQ